jgi:hypothetical protein
MKRIYLLLFVMLTNGFSFGQMVAPDWTHTDCNSNSHTLYNYLDSQDVVVMEFVMGCSSCTDAGTALMSLKDQYAVSHPGKVNFFLMDYYPANNCSTVTATWAAHNFDAYFSGCWNEKEAYYPSLYPMPAIVIAAGNFHTVIYNDLSWQTSDTTLIKQTIDQFFVTVGTEEIKKDPALQLFPNPANTTLQVDLTFMGCEQSIWNVTNMLGEKMDVEAIVSSDQKWLLDVSKLVNGSYILEVNSASGVVRKIFVKN